MPPLRPFGRTVCAMVTPFTAEGELDLDGAQRLADRLVGEGGCDGLVLSGTTGESPTTSDAEKSALIRAVAEAVGDRARITAGVGSADTRHTAELARAAEKAGAHGVLVVTPYYSRPPQEDVAEHFRTVADAVGLPVMLYDIPGRTGTRIEPETMLRLAEHPRIAGVKDCSYDLLGSSKVIARTGLAYYSGCEELNLPLRAVGATGYVSTVANVAGPLLAAALDAYDRGATAEATAHHQRVLPLTELMMAAGLPGTVTAKALLGALGLPGGPVRAPLRPADAQRTAALLDAYNSLSR
ncbi:4-hydroxy-tetrahydrodipicolinate synthase [Streptomyces griseocarneus]|uniref:4-hydroxy-tetrahydrodipicolinate synthase n=1 Tax=Streptomyces griseocarneus TaxID=51201 RepID=UPI00167CD0AA|nr:4-hydroxy-tetrahydrodipicolinate synthase [Streptomyces griseocarneus]MBZ6471830.1 4-hydroxy-tetrahydrodipicolinate synthase [Streptomyces griseocarneus]GHG71090.1 4-hydroxy-tetrahydrodipicolinate synthase 1 [Streptomyces griseocarneus]